MKSSMPAFLILLILGLNVIPGAAVLAQEGPSLHLEQVDTSGFPAITIRLNAWDEAGLPLSGLAPDNFLIQEDTGAGFHPSDLQVDQQAPLGVVLVMDISGSMEGAPLADARAAAARFLDRLEAGDRAALIAFSDPVDPDPAAINPERELAFTTDLAPLYDLIEGLQAGGSTQLYNAVAKAVRMAATLPAGHRAVLLLSDGRNDPAGVGDPDEAIALAQENDVPFFVIGLGDQTDETYLRRLANETGGLYRDAPRSSELAQLFTDTATLLKTQYVLGYTTSLPADGALHTLTITLNTSLGSAESTLEMGPFPAATRPSPTSTVAPATSLPPATSIPTAVPVDKRGDDPVLHNLWIWLLTAALAIGIGLWLGTRKRRRKILPEQCGVCGFDLTGKPGTCPQCGNDKRLPKAK